MRTRYMSYADYGITERDKIHILDFCRNANEVELQIIDTALSEINEYIRPYIKRSLTEGISYDRIVVKDEIYLSKEDFYGWRRKGCAAIMRWMIWTGTWKTE